MNNKTSGGFPADAFEKLASQEDNYWWFRSRNKIISWTVSKFLSHPQNFLEIGCGTGYVMKAIRKIYPESKLYGDEYFENGLKLAKKRVPSAEFRHIDATKMEDQNRFEAIGAFDVIEHINNDVIAIRNCYKALKKDGFLFITVPQHAWLWSSVDEEACHARRYSKIELKNKLEKSGFRVLFSTSFTTILLPAMIISRMSFFNKKLSKNEFDIPQWINFCFEVIMNLEIFLLKLGIRYPFGGSLLMVAHKS